MVVNYHALDARMENVQTFLPCLPLHYQVCGKPQQPGPGPQHLLPNLHLVLRIILSYYQNSESVREMVVVGITGHCCLTSLAENPPSKDIFEAIQNLPFGVDGSTMAQCPSQIPV
jgi:hypothetical protein